MIFQIIVLNHYIKIIVLIFVFNISQNIKNNTDYRHGCNRDIFTYYMSDNNTKIRMYKNYCSSGCQISIINSHPAIIPINI